MKRTLRWLALVLGCTSCDPKPTQAGAESASSSEPDAPPPAPPPMERAASTPPSPSTEEKRETMPVEAGETEAKTRYVVAALGDSITDDKHGGGGYLDFARKACPQSVFYNFGKGGDMTNQMLRRLKSDLLPVVEQRGIDTLIVYGGVNDLYSDLTAGRKNEVIEKDLATIYALAKAAGLRVVAITVSPWGGFTKYYNARRGDNTQLLNSWILEMAEKGEVDEVVDSYPLLSCGNSERLCPEYENIHADGLHPGPLGHQKLGQRLVEVALPHCR